VNTADIVYYAVCAMNVVAAADVVCRRPRRYVRCFENDSPLVPSASDVRYAVRHCNDYAAECIINSLFRLQASTAQNEAALIALRYGKSERGIMAVSVILPLAVELIACCALGGRYIFLSIPASFALSLILRRLFRAGKYVERELPFGEIKSSIEAPAVLPVSMEKEESRICDFVSRRAEIAALRKKELADFAFALCVYAALVLPLLVLRYEV